MYEVELKFPLPPGEAAERLLAKLADRGAAFGAPVTQADTYYQHPVRDFAATDEALRVRVVIGSDGVPRGRLTYKGPKLDAATKTREEFEPNLADGPGPVAALASALDRLGFRPVQTVTKTRRTARFEIGDGRTCEAAHDTVEGLGEFLELETTADEATLPKAREALLGLAAELRLGTGERRGYLEMLLDAADTPTGGG